MLADATKACGILPVSEASTLALLEQPLLFAGLLIPTADLEHFRRATDKAALLAIAGRLGIDTPHQTVLDAGQGVSTVFTPEQFPVVIKPARSVVGTQGHRRKVGVAYAGNAEQLRRHVHELGPDAGPLLIQSRIEGPGLGVFLLRWRGEIIASFAHKRIREVPPSGGVSVYCESVPPPAKLLAQSIALLEELDWTGVAMVEFKHDNRSGRDFLMEVNPRFWGSLQLAVDAGIDFPWYLAQLSLGQPVAPPQTWKAGVRLRWGLGDLDHLLARVRHSRTELSLPPSAPGVLRTASEVLRIWRPRQRGDVCRLSDPMPCIREAIEWIRALCRHRQG